MLLFHSQKIKLKRQLVCQASGKGGLQRNKVEGCGVVLAIFCFLNDSLFFVMTVMTIHYGKARKFQKSMKKKMYYS